VLIGVQYIAIVPVDEIGNARNDAFCVWAAEQQNAGVLHRVDSE
jgi:hypothetical protein